MGRINSRLGFCGFCLVLLATAGWAVPPVRTMYNDAFAREQAVRAALNAPDATPAVLAEVRALVATYESLVHRYPTSGYADNALWQGGRLALDAFARFGEVADRNTGVRLLRRLAATYPFSKLSPQVPEQLAAVNVENTAAEAAPPKSPTPRPAPASATAPPTENPATPIPRTPPTRDRIATIREIKRSVLPDAVRVTIELDGEVSFHDERIDNPDRVFLDLSGTRPSVALLDKTLRFASDADVVRQVRIGRHPNNTTRVVLDAGGVSTYSVYPLYAPYRLVIDCVRTSAATVSEPARASVREPKLAILLSRSLTAGWTRRLPSAALTNRAAIIRARLAEEAAALAVTPPQPAILPSRSLTSVWARRVPSGTPLNRAAILRARLAEEAAVVAVVPSNGPVAPLAAPSPPAPPPDTPPSSPGTSGGLSIARQLGLGVSRIVIDPGHGGHDPGAKGKGVTEAELVLDIALRVEKLLEQVPGVDVILTRRTDDFVPLPERTAIANRETADLFLSIHANASQNVQAHGIETYFLNFATNTSAAAVAARENAASTLAMGEMPDIVKAIALNNKVDESRDFAAHVQRAMLERLRTTNKTLKDLGVKQAPFVVLIGATMPSVLAEISFVTNPQEARLLKGTAYRQKIAESLFNAIRKYQTSLKNATAVAMQN
ncbi:MAG TPA: N-acetylmuramoyl-L-alanine amidase [Vicinamibacterales bacterium]|nr:N-acetylmuramoyl-L-alanine amidase [Vicinamibacterales bacterium]